MQRFPSISQGVEILRQMPWNKGNLDFLIIVDGDNCPHVLQEIKRVAPPGFWSVIVAAVFRVGTWIPKPIHTPWLLYTESASEDRNAADIAIVCMATLFLCSHPEVPIIFCSGDKFILCVTENVRSLGSCAYSFNPYPHRNMAAWMLVHLPYLRSPGNPDYNDSISRLQGTLLREGEKYRRTRVLPDLLILPPDIQSLAPSLLVELLEIF